MQAFLYLHLQAAGQPLVYQQAELELLKEHFPEVALLDIDADSDELLLHYASRMLQEATQKVVCIKADEGVSFHYVTTLLEELLDAQGQHLVVLLGENQQLQRILAARPQLHIKQISSLVGLLKELKAFF